MKQIINNQSWSAEKSFNTFGESINKVQNKQLNVSGIKIIRDNRKGYQMLLLVFLFQIGSLFSQALTYDNFEGNRTVSYGERNGVLDTAAKNPMPNTVNNSQKCALYIRNGAKKYDNIKMKVPANLADVSPYATYLGIPPKITMKIYTSAPVGTLVEILLGSKRGNNDYPAGTNSQYQAYTTVTNTWEELKFQFSQIPQGSETSTTQIDQITLLFNPNSSTSDTYYFDEITGPSLVSEKTEEMLAPKEAIKKVETAKKVEPAKKINTTKKVSKK